MSWSKGWPGALERDDMRSVEREVAFSLFGSLAH